MKYSFLIPILYVFFSHCKEKKSEPQKNAYALEKLFEEVRRIDTASAILDFEPDSACFQLKESMFTEFYPDPVFGLKGNVSSVIISEFSPDTEGKLIEDSYKEYLYDEGRPLKIIHKNSEDHTIKTLRYGISGLLVENKIVYPRKNDSITIIYHYDTLKRLNKMIYSDSNKVQFQTLHFFYHKNGNLDRVFWENKKTGNYTCKYFTNNDKMSYLQVMSREDGEIRWADYHQLVDNDKAVYSEDYSKKDGVTISHNTFQYNESGLLKQLDVSFKPGQVKMSFSQTYPKIDSAGSWVEMNTYKGTEFFGPTKRVITYK